MDSCFFCGKDFEAGYILKHKDRLFCSEACCMKQLYEDADDEIEAILFDTP